MVICQYGLLLGLDTWTLGQWEFLEFWNFGQKHRIWPYYVSYLSNACSRNTECLGRNLALPCTGITRWAPGHIHHTSYTPYTTSYCCCFGEVLLLFPGMLKYFESRDVAVLGKCRKVLETLDFCMSGCLDRDKGTLRSGLGTIRTCSY
jgi:hypothetical protein